MTKKTKAELELYLKEEKEVSRNAITFLIFFLIAFIVFLCLWVYAIEKNTDLKSQLETCQENFGECYDNLSKYRTYCVDASECFGRPNLTGCSFEDCNACCGSQCTLLWCHNFNFTFDFPIYESVNYTCEVIK